MKNTFHMSEFKEKLKDQFPTINVRYREVPIGKGLAHAFHIPISSSEELQERWRELSNFIALHFQREIEINFEQYNLYLFFEVPEEIEKDLKYKIENDIFSSRKIIILKGQKFKSITSYHILNTLHEVDTDSQKASTPYERNPTLTEIMDGKILKKRKITPEAFEVYDQYVKRLKNEI